MALDLAAVAARRVGLGRLAESSKSLTARLPIRYHSCWRGLRFQGAWKHRGHLDALAQGQVEPLTLARFESAVRPGATVLDAGAYLGVYTLTAAQRVGPAGRVVAIEPDPSVFGHLARAGAHNGFTARVIS